jgi:hypothetical protein
MLLAVAGAALWGLSIMQGLARASADARPIFDALGTAEEETSQDAAAVLLYSARIGVRPRASVITG